TLETELDERQAEHTRVAADKRTTDADLEQELAEIAKRIAGNQTLKAQADEIRSAVEAIAAIDLELGTLRARLEDDVRTVDATTGHAHNAATQETAARAAAADLARARTDAGLLGSVPCGGAGEFAACQFLKNAAAAKDRIAALETAAASLGELEGLRKTL